MGQHLRAHRYPPAWGGARNSGFGREHGEAAIENFTEPKAVWINTGPA